MQTKHLWASSLSLLVLASCAMPTVTTPLLLNTVPLQSASPTPAPTATPVPVASLIPAPVVTATPRPAVTPGPAVTPAPAATAVPTPTAAPTVAPTAAPTPIPTTAPVTSTAPSLSGALVTTDANGASLATSGVRTGDTLTISNGNFVNPTITVGGATATINSSTSTSLTFIVPAGVSGTSASVPVVVKNGDVNSSSTTVGSVVVAPRVTAISPAVESGSKGSTPGTAILSVTGHSFVVGCTVQLLKADGTNVTASSGVAMSFNSSNSLTVTCTNLPDTTNGGMPLYLRVINPGSVSLASRASGAQIGGTQGVDFVTLN